MNLAMLSKRDWLQLAWIYLTTFMRSFVLGCDYFGLRRGSWTDARFVARVVTRTCASIRIDGAQRRAEGTR